MSNILSNGGQGSNALIVRLELGVVLEGMGVKIQDEVDSGKHSNVTSGQFASEVITLEQILEMGEMLGDLNLQSVLPSLSLIAGGILRLGHDIVKIVLLLNELLRPVFNVEYTLVTKKSLLLLCKVQCKVNVHGEVVIVVARQTSLPGSEASNSHALTELEITVIQERQLTEGALGLQISWPFELLDPLERHVAEFEEKNRQLSTGLDIPVVKLGYSLHD